MNDEPDQVKDDRPRWEYHVFSSDISDTYHTFIDKLNIAGFQGWEVISISEVKDNDIMNLSRYIWTAWLKRKYRFERKTHFVEGKQEIVPFGENLYYV